jgi:hypothetical protein
VLLPQVEPAHAAALAIEAREQMNLRHAPRLVVREMARHAKHRVLAARRCARERGARSNRARGSAAVRSHKRLLITTARLDRHQWPRPRLPDRPVG